MHKIYLFLTLLLVSFHVSASSVDVVATPPSGTYHTPVHITLTPTQAGTKTFYSFKPDGYPQDAFLYTGSILLKHSSPLIYFSIISTSNESKIKQNDYIIEYPSAIHFESESISGSGQVEVIMVNSGSENVNIGFWQVQSESDTVIIPEDTILAPWGKQSVYVNYPGKSSIVLRSPDDDERDILISESTPENTLPVLPKKKSVTTKIVPRKIISTRETASEDISTLPKVSDIPVVQIPTEEKVSTSPPSTPLDINQIMKASTAESGQKSLNPLYPILFLLLSFGIGWIQWFIRRKQK
ncbi:MAG: hypothetical protein PHN60_00875 [Candidatus Gracilibacteria bacterium]|nr:hypothetical protein [Candidatus Gracilibacteria bacterium]